VLLKKGPDHVAVLKRELYDWLEQQEYQSVTQMKGSVSRSCAINPAALEHCNYMHVIKSYSQ
jgi:dihydroorotate dehydrogenase (fumarate)